jgi:hypothetical protein
MHTHSVLPSEVSCKQWPDPAGFFGLPVGVVVSSTPLIPKEPELTFPVLILFFALNPVVLPAFVVRERRELACVRARK